MQNNKSKEAQEQIQKNIESVKSFNRFKEFLKNKVKKPYYYVGECPNCGSEMTGRFIKAHSDYDDKWAIKQALKNGEIVIPISNITYHNVSCLECDNTWHEDVSMSLLSLSGIETEKIKRHTPELLKGLIQEESKNKKDKEEERGFVANKVSNFIGHI